MTPRSPILAGVVLGLASVVFAGFLTSFAACQSVAPTRTRLADQLDFQGDVVTLADLLPATASPELRDAAKKIPLGAAPQPGANRQISRQEIGRALAGHPELAPSLVLPESVIVGRHHRQITHAEIEQAVTDFLKANGASGAELEKLKGVSLFAPVYVTTPDPGLRVIGAEYDALHQETRLRLWTSKQPQVLPFYLSLPDRINPPEAFPDHRTSSPQEQVGASYVQSAGQGNGTPKAHASVQTSPWLPPEEQQVMRPAKAEILVKAGVPAKLRFEGAGFRVETVVIPLTPGAMGEQIRVRRQDNQRLLMGHVVGPDLLQAN